MFDSERFNSYPCKSIEPRVATNSWLFLKIENIQIPKIVAVLGFYDNFKHLKTDLLNSR